MRIVAGLLIVLALVVSIVPQFTDCQSQGKSIALPNGKTIPMKCHWTARAELATGVPILFLGSIMAFSREKKTKQALSFMGIVLGAVVILLPTSLIGVCTNPEMVCSMIMKPLLTLSGALIVAGSVVGLLLTVRKRTDELSA